MSEIAVAAAPVVPKKKTTALLEDHCAFKHFIGKAPVDTGFVASTSTDINANARIKQIQFQMLKGTDVTRCSHLEVINRNPYQMDRQVPVPWGPLDSRFGCSSKDGVCATCGKKVADCLGHFGHVTLALPVFHIGYFKEVQKIQQCVCKKCSRILLPNDNFKQYFLNKMRKAERRGRITLRDEIMDIAKRVKTCPHCGSRNGTIRKLTGVMKYIHDLREKETKKDRDAAAEKILRDKEIAKQRRKARQQNLLGASHTQYAGDSSHFSIDTHSSAPQTWKQEFHDSFRTAIEYNSSIGDFMDKCVLEMSPLLVLKLFANISNEDCFLLNFDPSLSRPEDMIVTHMAVPPVCIRPSVQMGASGSNEDDLTIKIGEIVFVSNFIKDGINALNSSKGITTGQLIENWDYLQLLVAAYVNSDLPGFNKAQLNIKPIRSLSQRLKGKTGRFRGNLSGKRVDFSSRTVISPDPNLRVDQVGVPERVAKVLTFPERVYSHNIAKLRKAILNGPDVHPGANVVEICGSNAKISLQYADKVRTAANLKEGDIVERHLNDDDVVLFNRQPSLHRMSIMAHRAKVLQWRTFRFNECVCSPYNADFDGDEMNLHLPQTLEAKAEALELMAVMNNLVTPRNGEPLIHATQDFITASFLITSKDRFLNRGQFCYLTSGMSDALDTVKVPVPAIIKPMSLWTGKQVFSLLLRPNKNETDEDNVVGVLPWPVISVELKAKNNTRMHCMDPVDGYVVIRNSELLCGSIDKDALGGSKKGMFYQIIRSGPSGSLNASRFLNRLAKFSARYISSYGFSIGIDDVTPSLNLRTKKDILVQQGYIKCTENIETWKRGKLALRPGCNEIQTLESLLLGELSTIREDAGSECFRDQNILYNTPLIMAISGSKGSKINISQMTACVGQQAINGSRIPEGFHLRTLPHFAKYSREPDAKGFVANSFYSGLTATEFFFHTMGGREGLVDTAVKTAETGYMQRRLMKALEDLCVQYDGSVRSSEKNIIQFLYGDDGLDPVLMANGVLPVNFGIYFEQCRSICSQLYTFPNKKLSDVALKAALNSILPSHQLEDSLMKQTNKLITMSNKPVVIGEDPTLFHDWVGYSLTNPEAKIVNQAVKQEYTTEFTDVRRQLLGTHDAILVPHELYAIVHAFCKHPMITTECTNNFIDGLLTFIEGECKQLWATFKALGFTKDVVLHAINSNNMNALSTIDHVTTMAMALTVVAQAKPCYKSQVNIFLNGSFARYRSSRIEPGTAVGAIGGQSIGEPGTQMTLKTFHFAGVASMNITLGVPRIKEIINASKKINTPIITAPLECDTDVKSARIVKGRIETTKLGEIAKSIDAVFSSSRCYIKILLDMDTIDNLQLNINAHKVAAHIENARKLKLKGKVRVQENCVEIEAPALQITSSRGGVNGANSSSILQALHALKNEISSVVVDGIPSVSRAVINDDGSGKYHLLVEGYDLLSVMTTMGVKGLEAKSNHIIEIGKTLGIEAARSSIMNEISHTMESHGLHVDVRHCALLADIMTYKGEILGITRFGIAKMKESVLMLASFEKTSDHLFEAALRGTTDNINGVSECIIMGTQMPVGTGLFSLTQKSQGQNMPTVGDYEKAVTKLRSKGKPRDVVSIMKQIEKGERNSTIQNDEQKNNDIEVHVKDEIKKPNHKKRQQLVMQPLAGAVIERKKENMCEVDIFAKRTLAMNDYSRL